MAQNENKNRKSEEQKRFEEADNAGRFAGEDNDSQAARNESREQIRQDTGSSRSERGTDEGNDSDDDQVILQANEGDAQNISDDDVEKLSDEGRERSRNKASEGQRQQEGEG
jgi:hypothetical protein